MRACHLASLIVALAATALAQPPQNPASGPPPPALVASSHSALPLDRLENDPTVLAAAEEVLVPQIVGNYNQRSPQSAPQIFQFWGTFNVTLLNALVRSASTRTAQTRERTSQTNTQTGAPCTGSGSTSLGQKVGIPQLLAIAVENGAIADSVSGTTMTLSTTPYGFAYAFAKDQDTSDNYQNQPILTHTGISATFNVADTSDPLQSASRKAVSQWQIKYTFRDTSARSLAVNCLYLFKPGTTVCHKKSDLLQPSTSDLAKANENIVKGLSDSRFVTIRAALQQPENDAYQRAWTSGLQILVAAGKTEDIGKAILLALDNDPGVQQALQSWVNQLSGTSSSLVSFIQSLKSDQDAYNNSLEPEFEAAVKNLTKGLNGDFAFSQKFPSPTTTSTSTSTSSTTVSPPAYLVPEPDISYDPKTKSPSAAAAGAGTSASSVTATPSFTGNFSGGFYSNPNSSLHESTFRGAQAALQFQWSLGAGPFYKVKSAGDDSEMTLCFSGNYQRLQENEDQKGKRPDLVTGNIKLQVPNASGVSFPLAVSFGNATSQVKGNYVVGNFGISFDLDDLAALAKLKQ